MSLFLYLLFYVSFRINGENNDLPWEFTVERYPTIIFFPAKR